MGFQFQIRSNYFPLPSTKAIYDIQIWKWSNDDVVSFNVSAPVGEKLVAHLFGRCHKH